MDPAFLFQQIELLAIGLIGGFIAGLLGLGGGVIIIPLLVFGAGIPMTLATGISMVQAFFATTSGVIIHRRNRTILVPLGTTLGVAGVLGAIVGSVGSAQMGDQTLLWVYFCLVIVAVFLLFMAPRIEKTGDPKVNLWLAFPMGLGVGVLAGMLGVGGGFIMMPLMISVLKIPTRLAVGTSLLMIIPTTFTGGIGKILTGQFDLSLAGVVIVGSILGAQGGGRVNTRVSPRTIRTCLLVLLFGILLRTGFDLLIA